VRGLGPRPDTRHSCSVDCDCRYRVVATVGAKRKSAAWVNADLTRVRLFGILVWDGRSSANGFQNTTLFHGVARDTVALLVARVQRTNLRVVCNADCLQAW
jgi:hypothetical protein